MNKWLVAIHFSKRLYSTFDVINWNEFKLQLKIEQKLMNLLSKLKSVFYNKHLMHPSVISELLHNYNLRFGMINVFKRENLDKHFEMSWWFHRMENQKNEWNAMASNQWFKCAWMEILSVRWMKHELEMEFRVNMLMNFILIFQHIESISCGKYVRILKCVFNWSACAHLPLMKNITIRIAYP